MRRAPQMLLALALLLSRPELADAGTIVDFTTATNSASGLAFGQEVSTGSGGPWDDITFSFLSEPSGTPVASGSIFLLSQQYFGTPQNLSSSTSGYLAESTGVANGAWDFASSITLQANTNYWFYTNGSVVGSFNFNVPGNAGEHYYDSVTIGGNFMLEAPSSTADFRLTGDPVGVSSTPEPSSFVLFGIAVTGLGVARWRNRKQAA